MRIVLQMMVVLAVLVLPLARAALAQPPQPFAYRASFAGAPDEATATLLKEVSDTARLSGKPVADMFLLRGRARGDLKKLTNALASRGFFSAKASFSIDEKAVPVQVRFTVDPGGPFLLKWVDVELTEDSPPVTFTLPEAAELGLTLDQPAVSSQIENAQDKLVSILKNRCRPFARVVRRKAVGDYRERTLHVTYIVDAGPNAVFGPTRFEGLKDVKEDLLQSLIPWKEGDQYRQDLVDAYQRQLANLGLFAKAAVAPRKKLESPDKAVMEASVTERTKRTFKGGVTYNTDDGPGARVFWEHRNLFGRGERLRLHAAVSPVSKVLEANFENPFFLSPKQRLLAGIRAADENTKAFHGQNVIFEMKISRDLFEHVRGDVGVGVRSSLIYDDAANPYTDHQTYGLAYIPLSLAADTRDDPLNATKGWMATVNASPYFDTRGTGLNFVKGGVSGAHYLQVLEKPSIILASRLSVGSISGVSASRLLPPDIRYYAGGSGSIRGYAYQTAGPLRGDKPLGGRSVLDGSVELRLRLTEMFGLVFFADGGNAYETQYPDPTKGILAGIGTGLRVFTPIGPFRVDVATPLYRRSGDVDSPVQFYISLGQAF